MQKPPHIARGLSLAALLSSLALALSAALLRIGCGSAYQRPPATSPMLLGTGATPIPAADLAPASRLSHRFANAYARSVYRRSLGRLPGATTALTRRLAQAAGRVSAARRHLRPRALEIVLRPAKADALQDSVEIGDGRFPAFSVGFTLEKRDRGWHVVSVSAPG